MTRVLIIEDEATYRETLGYLLRKEGFDVVEAADGTIGLAEFERGGADIVLLDLMMPGLPGTEVCRRLRARSSVPVIMVTARDDEIDKVVGLELGADDYVTKPFSPRELVLRVKALLKRRRGDGEPRQALVAGDLRLDRERHEVTIGKKAVDLTATEFKLLAHLMEYPGRAMTRDQLLDSVWGMDAFVTDRTIDTHVKRLRAKLGKLGERVETVRGVGYRFRE